MMQPNRSLLSMLFSLCTLSGCAFYFEFGGPESSRATPANVPSADGGPTASPADGGGENAFGDGSSPESAVRSTASGDWNVVAAPMLAEGSVRIATQGRTVWLAGPRQVHRLDLDRDRVSTASANAQGLAGSVALVSTDRGELFGWSPVALVRHDTQTDTLVRLSREGAPASFVDPLVAWTGNGLLVWGGGSASGRTSDGALYVSSADRWIPTPGDRAPVGRTRASSVWTGTQLVVFGGAGAGDTLLGDAAAYGPGVSTWITLSPTNAPSARAGHTAVWSGHEMIVWGGQSIDGARRDGVVWDARTASWRAIAAQGAPSARYGHVAVWTGRRMIVFGGTDGRTTFDDGAVFDPVLNQWSSIPSIGVLAARTNAAATWTGREFVVAGGTREGRPVGDVVIWRPTTL